MSHAHGRSKDKRRLAIALVITLALLVAAVVGGFFCWWYLRNDEKQVVEETPISAEQAQRLIALKTSGLALLENAEYEKAAEAFSKIATALPQEPFAHRNLAIARLLIFNRALTEKKNTAEAGARQCGKDICGEISAETEQR